jgi:hypothetical protein
MQAVFYQSGVHLHIICTAIDRKQEAQTLNETRRAAQMGSTFLELESFGEQSRSASLCGTFLYYKIIL